MEFVSFVVVVVVVLCWLQVKLTQLGPISRARD
jgi:hypothetical protein